MARRKVIKMKRRFRPNLAFLIFLLILIYIAVLLWSYLTKEHVSIYEVNTTDISDDTPLYGFILRSEEVVTAEDGGYINYYHAESSRISAGDVVYTIDESGEIQELLDEIQQTESPTENVTAIREAISDFQNNFDMSNYTLVSGFKYDIDNIVMEQNKGTLFQALNKKLKESGTDKNFKKIKAKKAGVISYSIDGYENVKQSDISEKLFHDYGSVTRNQLQSIETTSAGSPVYKLVTNNTWSLVVKPDDAYYEQLKTMDTVRVTVDKDNISFNAAVELFDRDGIHFAKLTTSRFMERYINDRFLKIEFHLKSASGLKIPNSSILTKEYYVLPAGAVTKTETKGVIKQTVDSSGAVTDKVVSLGSYFVIDGQYYVDAGVVSAGDVLRDAQTGETYTVSSMEKLSGVYLVNEGYCQFRPIVIRYQNKEYTIVEENTPSGLSAYDHIVVDPSHLTDDDFIE